MTRDEAMDLLREAIRLEKLARLLVKEVDREFDFPPVNYHLGRGDAQTALEVMEER